MGALYRKWRPKDFDEVRGQDAICTTLKNQVLSGRISHAYLFCGTRGTGKTSIAKIMARAVNCENPTKGNPCNACPSCLGIIREGSVNVLEMDAASNNGVDNIRDIKERIQYPPSEGKYRVFIIDEVHMLSLSAFNALLKTLEEPPSYVIFILATTEVQKLPQTILSRCQRYDFRRISAKVIEKRLSELVREEGIEIEEKALSYISRQGDGSLRDAISILDECIAFCPDGEISYEKVLDILSATDNEVFADLFAAIRRRDTLSQFSLVEKILEEGRELSHFIADFIWYLRNLMILQAAPGGEGLIEASPENIAAMQEAAKAAPREMLMRCIRVFSRLSDEIRYSSQKRILLELALLRLAAPRVFADMDALLERVAVLEDRLEQALSGAAWGNGVASPLSKNQGGKGMAAGEGGANMENRPSPSRVRLTRAGYDDYLKLREDWEDILHSLGGSLASVFRGTYLEPLENNVFGIAFPSKGYYNIGLQEGYLQEIIRKVQEKYEKEFQFQILLREEGGAAGSEYVTEEELRAALGIELDIE